MGGIIAAVVGAVLAVLAGVGLVSSQSAVPPVPEAAYITYDG
jgi:hypothetical protein